jgi:hypothetical protein
MEVPLKPEVVLKGSLFLAAFLSMVLSIVLYFAAGDDTNGRLNGVFVGIWVPSILSMGALLLTGRESRR